MAAPPPTTYLTVEKTGSSLPTVLPSPPISSTVDADANDDEGGYVDVKREFSRIDGKVVTDRVQAPEGRATRPAPPEVFLEPSQYARGSLSRSESESEGEEVGEGEGEGDVGGWEEVMSGVIDDKTGIWSAPLKWGWEEELEADLPKPK